jgi:disulfide oxidoreductase YuzD
MTAVEWLVETLNKKYGNDDFIITFINEIEQAKEMEKEQIIDFANDFIEKHTFGDYDGQVQKNKTVEEYYNETFKKQ